MRSISIDKKGKRVKQLFPKRAVVIERGLQNPCELGRKRFTIAHEGAHFILNQHVPMQAASAFHSDFNGDITYSKEMLEEMMSINEAFANRAAACCLMPQFLVERNLKKHNSGTRLSSMMA